MTKQIHAGKIHAPYIVCFQTETNTKYNHLYISDDLISSRISFDEKEVTVKYYKFVKELNIPWYKFWIDKYEVLNRLNTDLFYEAIAVANHKQLKPIMAPIRINPC